MLQSLLPQKILPKASVTQLQNFPSANLNMGRSITTFGSISSSITMFWANSSFHRDVLVTVHPSRRNASNAEIRTSSSTRPEFCTITDNGRLCISQLTACSRRTHGSEDADVFGASRSSRSVFLHSSNCSSFVPLILFC